MRPIFRLLPIIAAIRKAVPVTRTTYQAAVLSDTPVGFWPLNETTGTVVHDISGNGLNGSIIGSLTLGAPSLLAGDSSNTCMHNNGGYNYISVPDNALLDIAGDFALEFWGNFDSGAVPTGNYPKPVCKYGSDAVSGQVDYSFQQDKGNGSILGARASVSGSYYNDVKTTYAINDGVTRHFVLVKSGTTLSLYVNGSLYTTSTLPSATGVTSAASALSFFCTQTDVTANNGAITGALQNIAIYSSALSAARIQAHYTAGVASYVAPSYEQQVLWDRPSAYWKLNERSGTVAIDSSGNGYSGVYNGTYSLGGTSIVNGELGGALSVTGNGGDGSDYSSTAIPTGAAYINGISNPSGINFGSNFTVEAWVQLSSLPSAATDPAYSIFGLSQLYGDATYGGYLLAIDHLGRLKLDSTFVANIANSTGTVAIGTPQHVAVTVDGTGNYTFYINGQVAGSGNTTTRFNGSDAFIGVQVGRDETQYSHFFAGILAHVAVYNRALPAARLAAHYAIGTSAYTGAVMADAPDAYWPLNETAGTAAADITGNGHTGAYNGTYTLGASELVPNRASGYSLSLGGAGNGPNSSSTPSGSGWVEASNVSNLTYANTFTAEAWIKLSTYPGDVYPIVGGQQTDLSNDGGYVFGVGSSGQLLLNTTYGALTLASANSVVQVNSSHHVAVTVDASLNVIFYVDGAQVGTGTFPRNFSAGGVLRIGVLTAANGNRTDYFGGSISDVALYPRVLSATRITAHYVAGAGAPSYRGVVLSDAPIGYWPMSETSGSVYADLTGNGHALNSYQTAPSNGQTGIVPSDSGGSISVSGSSQLRQSSNNLPATLNTASIEAWVRTTQTGGMWGCIAALGNPTNGLGPFYLFAEMGTSVSPNQVPGVWITSPAGVSDYVTAPSTINDGKFHHLVGTYDGAQICLYIDGALVASKANTAGLMQYAAILDVACSYQNGNHDEFYSGSMAHLALYGTALSAARVAAHYSAGIGSPYMSAMMADSPFAMWRLGESLGTTAYDIVSGYNGTYSGGYTLNQAGLVANDTSSCVLFDGGSGGVTIPANSTLSNMNRSFTIESVFELSPGWTPGVQQLIYSSGADGFCLYIETNGTLCVGHSDDAGLLGGTTVLSPGVKYHAATTVDASGNAVIYLNGAVYATGSVSGTTFSSTTNACIGFDLGHSGTQHFYFHGWIQYVALYGSALSATRIGAHHAAYVGSARYISAVTSDSPYLFYPMDEASGTAFSDLSGNGRNGVPSAVALAGIVGPLGKSVASFDGSSSYAKMPVLPDMASFSVEFFGFLPTGATSPGGIVFSDCGTNAGNSLIVYVDPAHVGVRNDKNPASLYDPGGIDNVNMQSVSDTQGVWHHFVYVFGGSETLFYVDGVLRYTYTNSGGNLGNHNAAGATIGRWDDGPYTPNGYFDGGIGYFALYNYALTGTQVATHYNASL